MLPLVVIIPAAVAASFVAVAYAIARTNGNRQAMLHAPPLAHELPYWHVTEEGVIVHVDLAYSAILEVRGADSDCLSQEALLHKTRGLHATFAPLRNGVTLQWLYINDTDQRVRVRQYEQGTRAHDLARLLAEEKSAAVTSGQFRRSRIFLCCTVAPDKVGLRANRFPSIDETTHRERVSRILGLREEVRSGLINAGFGAEPLIYSGVRGLLYECLNPTRQTQLPAPLASQEEIRTLREDLVFSGATEYVKALELDGQLVRVVSLKALPQETYPALIEHLTVNLEFPCRISMSVEILDDQKKLDRLKRRRDQAWALSRLSNRPNQEAQAQAEELEGLIDEVIRGGNRLVHIALSVVITVDASQPDAARLLEERTAEVLAALAKANSSEGMVEEYAQLDSWLATLPAGAHYRSRWHSCTSENAAHLLPCWQSWKGHAHPALIFGNGRNYLVGLDPFDSGLPNPNAVMAGKSGGGKSVTTNYLLMHLLAKGARALVVDVGGSYRRLIELFGGDYISLSAEADPALNLFQPVAEVVGDDGSFEQLRLDFMLSVLAVLIRGEDRGPLSNEERAVLDQAMRAVYAGRSETPILGDLYEELRVHPFEDAEDQETARRLARRLRFWITGPHARILNRPSTIHLATSFGAFDLQGLPEEVRPAVVLIIAGIIWNLVRSDNSVRKVVVFDEVWTLLSDPQSQRLLETLYRTSRKHACSILSLSQSVSDFTKSAIAHALVQNAATTYLLDHEVGHDDIATVFQLNARERNVLKDLEMKRGKYSEMLVLSGRDRTVARVYLTPLEYWIATTHAADTRELAALRTEYPKLSLLEVLRECARRYPRGVEAAVLV